MTTLDAILLGVVQGLTEFLPVSSSGHLKLVQYFLGLQNLDRYIVFDLVCHLGSLLAIIMVFFRPIRHLFATNSRRLWQVVIGTLPLFPLLLIMKPIKAVYADPSYLGFFFLLTAAILFVGCRFGKIVSEIDRQKHPWRDALLIGVWQAVAIFPGVSRSGSTISGARLLGWGAYDAVFFSFLLAIPAILGGTVLEVFKLWLHPETVLDLPLSDYIAGFVTSFLVGFASLQLLLKLAVQNKFSYFAWYCLFLGLMTIYYFHFH
ncbi:MAG: undecaprenyl-diphosphate phosphatase [Parachlamydiaceae bacterium]